jgi:hypothetical protein
MKKISFVIVVLVFMQYSSVAQEANSRIRELGINLSGSTFGIRYKAGNENTLFRVSLLSLGGSSSKYLSASNIESTDNSQGLGFNFGFEKRKLVSDNLNFYYGSDLLTSYQRHISKNGSPTQTNKGFSFSPGLGLLLGFNFKISSKINISAEVMPSISYSIYKSSSEFNGTTNKTSSTRFDYGLGTNGVNLTLSFNL